MSGADWLSAEQHARVRACGVRPGQDNIDGLCAEVTRLRTELAETSDHYRKMLERVTDRDRVLDLEDQVDRLRAERVNMQAAVERFDQETRRHRATIARVRELCEPGSPVRAAGLAEQVLRALDGGTE